MQRIQRKRAKGWRKPDNAVIVTRPTRWGNPYRIGIDGDADKVVRLYRIYLDMMRLNHPGQYRELLEPLRGKDLACFCKEGDACHATVLLELVAEMEATE